jgi:hypothetical protein
MLLANQLNGSFQFIARNIAAWSPTLTITTATPYLLVGCASPNGNASLMAVNLNTGVITTAFSAVANGTPGVGNGTFLLGNLDTAVGGCNADLSAVLFSNVYLSLGELQQWARDPWGPWRIPEFDPALFNFVVPASTGAQSFVSVM